MFGPFVFGFQGAGCGDRHARGGWEGFGDWGGGPPRGKAHWRGRAARLFEQGDLKYVILRLLEEKPRHGYDIIKELESRFGGLVCAQSRYGVSNADHARGSGIRPGRSGGGRQEDL